MAPAMSEVVKSLPQYIFHLISIYLTNSSLKWQFPLKSETEFRDEALKWLMLNIKGFVIMQL